jgi:hypothetical protein
MEESQMKMKAIRDYCARSGAVITNLKVVGVCFLASLLVPLSVYAADHLDGPAVSSDPAADVTDVYAWAQDGNTLNLILNVFPLADASSKFSDSVQYVFRVNSVPSYGTVDQESLLVCTFSMDQLLTCALDGTALVEGVDASSTEGVTSADGRFRVFAGLRNDPFFFDLTNFNTVRATVRDAAASLTFDEAGCPTLDEATQGVLVSTITGAGGLEGANSPPSDFFGSLNVLSIVVQADKSMFGGGPLYSVSGSTHRK